MDEIKMNQEDRICTKCKYSILYASYWCKNPKTSSFDPVTGYNSVRCDEARSHTVGKCGPSGVFFEAVPEVPVKKSFWKGLFNV
jgi:hypothetical protein